MAEQERDRVGKKYPMGSPDDLRLTFQIMEKFFAAKLKAIDMHRGGDVMSDSTGSTWCVCHVDGVVDGDP